MKNLVILLLLSSTAISGCVNKNNKEIAKTQIAAIEVTLNDLHDAASKSDEKRYFDHFASKGVFFGTAPEEKWGVEAFRAYAKPIFDKGKGWTFKVVSREISLSDDENVAWFDESLYNNSYGECRGTGVLVKYGNDWKIAQYNLSIPLPNDITGDIVKMIKSNKK